MKRYFAVIVAITEMMYNSEASAVFFEEIYSDELYIGEFIAVEAMSFSIKRTNKDGEQELLSDLTLGIPNIDFIDDVIMNLLGGIIGYSVYLFNFYARERNKNGNMK